MDPSIFSILIKTAVTHTVTYFFVGLAAFKIFDYPHLFVQTGFRYFMRPTTDIRVRAGIFFQPLRGILLGIAFGVLRQSLFIQSNGWLLIWITLLCLSILGTFGPTLASIEGMVFSKIPLRTQLIGFPEILAQSFLLSFIVFHWVRSPEAKRLGMTMWTFFILALAVPMLGLLTKRAKCSEDQ
jgi:hypothetical protein